MSITDTPAIVVADRATDNDKPSYVDWPAIIGGAALAAAISVVFLTFGSALGLSMTSPYEGEGAGVWGLSLAAGLWLLWVQISSFMAGAYLTGRLRRRAFDATEHESDIRDGAHGLLVWAVSILVGSVIAFSTIGAVSRTAADAVGTVAAGAVSAAGDAASNPVVAGYVDRVFRSESGQPIPAETRAEVARIFATSAVNGEFAEADRAYVAGLVSRSTGVTPEEARATIDETIATAEQAEQAARDAAETARKTALILAFITAASLLVSAAASFYAAGVGGRHRDEGMMLDWTSFR
jgi:hypothetical protein